MSIYSHHKDEIKYVIVLNEMMDVDCELFLLRVNQSSVRLEILFLDTGILPLIIIEELSILAQNKGGLLKVIVNSSSLSYYLSSLSIRNTEENLLNKSKYKYNAGTIEDTAFSAPEHRLNSIIDEKDSSLQKIEVKDFLEELYFKYGNDFRNYYMQSVMRRIEVTRTKLSFSSFKDLTEKILEGGEEYYEFLSQMSINVTEFFRDPIQLKIVKNKVEDYLESFPGIRIWCAGCSTGEEAYSIAILLEEAGLLKKSIIYATDFNDEALKKAKNGLYSIDEVNNGAKNYFQAEGQNSYFNHFIKENGYYKIKPEYKKHIAFLNHNLCTDGVFNKFQLILCRNVLIYFDSILHEKVIKLFHASLHTNGFLLIGKSESFVTRKTQLFSLPSINEKLYKKVD